MVTPTVSSRPTVPLERTQPIFSYWFTATLRQTLPLPEDDPRVTINRRRSWQAGCHFRYFNDASRLNSSERQRSILNLQVRVDLILDLVFLHTEVAVPFRRGVHFDLLEDVRRNIP